MSSELKHRAFGVMMAGAVCLSFFLTATAHATTGINPELNFQGKIVLADGTNIADGFHNMEFKIYSGNSCDPNTGGSCTLDWTGDWLVSASHSVQFVSGTFQANLGSVSSFGSSVDWNSYPLYLSVQVGNTASCTISTSFQSDCGGDGEMKPYILLTATPYALNAGELSGLSASDFGQLAIDQVRTGTYAIQNTSSAAFAVQDAGGSNTTLAVDTGSGYVGIGTPTPGANLDIKNATPGTAINVTVSASPAANMVSISNAGHPVATNDVSGLDIVYAGGSVPSSGGASAETIHMTPGSTNPSAWNGLHIISDAGATSGVQYNGLEVDGPSSSSGGTATGLAVTTGWDIGLDVQSGGLQLKDMNDPSAPAANSLRVYASSVAGRSMLKALGPSGVDYSLQPSLFQQNVVLVTGGNGTSNTTYTTIGSNVTASGTLASQSGSNSEALGNTSRIATGTTAGTVAGFFTKNTYYLGSVANGADGFFYFTRMNLNAQTLTNYKSATTGSRIFMGLCGATFTSCGTSDSPTTSNVAGFQFSGSRGDNNFQFLTCNAAACNTIDTGVAISNSSTYDFYAYTPAQGNTVHWRIDDITNGTAPVEGSSSTDIPTGSGAMNAGDSITNLSGANRFLYFQRMYLETDR